jgi:phospholipid/cholesterol/gamma-HCH transport system permease protein
VVRDVAHPVETPSPASPERGELAVTRDGDGTVVVRLAGRWRLAGGLPSPVVVERELATGTVRRVRFDARDLKGWDTSVVTYLDRLSGLCQQRKIPVDRDGLPPGLQRLLRLAEAVPEKQGARRTESRDPWLARIGKAALSAWEGTTAAFGFVGDVALSAGRGMRGQARFRWVDFVVVLQACGAEALPIVTLISVLVGMILAFVGAVQLTRFGAAIYVADLVAIAMVREMGCIMTAIIMAGRTGSGFAAEIGTMKVTQELDALQTLALPPMDFLVLPRMLALSLMMPLLCIYADLLGIVGGGLVAVGMLDLTVVQYINETKAAITLTSYATGIGKSVVFGILIAIAGCLRGVQSGSSSSAVGDAATSAVVTGIVLIVVADGVFAVLFHVLGI